MIEETNKHLLMIQEKIKQIREKYAAGSSQYANILVAGEHGTGKTQLYSTCPLPVHIDSFDPGGTTTAKLRPLIESGDIIVETFESDDWSSPYAYREWERSFQEKRNCGYFDHIGTYGIDSATNWVVALMGQVMKIGKGKNVKPHPGENPYESDYLHQQLIAANILRRDIMSLPCHTLVTAHLSFIDDKDDEGRVIATRTSLLMWGKLAHQFPLVFDENYVMVVRRSGSGEDFKILTRNDGLYRAKTRIGGDGKFEKYEDPNIKALLKKAGKHFADKPRIA